MYQAVAKLENLLIEQMSLYRELYILEEDKTGLIIQKNGSRLQEICVNQENIVGQIEILEGERSRILSEICGQTKKDNSAVTISEISSIAGADESGRLMATGSELKQVILKLKVKQETNAKLLKDNLEFFSIFMSGLKNSSSLKAGYGSDGKENSRVVNPVLFNTKA